jgi:hypothetical protein
MGKLKAKTVETSFGCDKEYKLHDGDGLFLRARPSVHKAGFFPIGCLVINKLGGKPRSEDI